MLACKLLGVGRRTRRKGKGMLSPAPSVVVSCSLRACVYWRGLLRNELCVCAHQELANRPLLTKVGVNRRTEHMRHSFQPTQRTTSALLTSPQPAGPNGCTVTAITSTGPLKHLFDRSRPSV